MSTIPNSFGKTGAQLPFTRRTLREYSFLRFFTLGLEESASPFLNPTARGISRNFSLKASIIAALLFATALFFHLMSIWSPLDYVLLTLCMLIVAPASCIQSLEDLSHKDVNIDVLMTVAALGSCLIGKEFEGALLLVLFALSGALEDVVTLKAKKSLTRLEELIPEKATVIENEILFEKAVVDIKLGDILYVRHGELVPLDGKVISGRGAVSLAHLTGEAHPITVREEESVLAGGRLVEGAIQVVVERTSTESTLARLVELITQAHETKPILARTFEQFGRMYASGIMIAALVVAFGLPLITSLDISFLGDSGSLMRALSFLITASPCALVLAVPIAYISSLGLFARKGVIVKGSRVIDALVLIPTIAFDKTGTLTYGKLSVASSLSDLELQVFAAIERGSSHPVALAIVDEASKKNISMLEIADFHSIPGEGVEGKVLINGEETFVFVGSLEEALKRVKIGSEQLQNETAEARSSGFITTCGVINGVGHIILFEDTIRSGAQELVERLQTMGKELYLLTGDSSENGQRIGKMLGIDHVEAQLKPEDKLQRIRELARETGLVMVGDGINDAPALARATVGISMGTMSSAAAREASDIILLNDNIELIDWIFNQATRTYFVVLQNLILAILVIVLASISALLGELSLWAAVVLHEGGTVLVGLNGLRLLRDPYTRKKKA